MKSRGQTSTKALVVDTLYKRVRKGTLTDEKVQFDRSFDVALGDMQRGPKAGVELSRCLSPAKSRTVRVGAAPGSVTPPSSQGWGLVVVEGVLTREE